MAFFQIIANFAKAIPLHKKSTKITQATADQFPSLPASQK